MAIFNTVPPLKAGSGIQFDGEVISTRAAQRNLLDNSNFLQPVNQMNFASGDVSWKYIFDRWMANGNGFVLGSNGLTVPAGGEISQRFEKGTILHPSKMTIAIGLADGSVLSGIAGDTVGGVDLSVANSNNAFDSIRLTNNSGKALTVKHLALYDGVYDADTLPEYQAKTYAQELLECKRYYVRAFALGAGFLTGNRRTRNINVHLPVKMRANPAVSFPADMLITVRTVGGYDNEFPLSGGTPSGATLSYNAIMDNDAVSIALTGNECTVAANNTPIAITPVNKPWFVLNANL